jgi:hypothetical protein
MNKLILATSIALTPVSCALTACAPGGGINSASAAHACSVASSAGAALDAIARDLAAAGFAKAKIEAMLPLIAQGRLAVTVTCDVVLPPHP